MDAEKIMLEKNYSYINMQKKILYFYVGFPT